MRLTWEQFFQACVEEAKAGNAVELGRFITKCPDDSLVNQAVDLVTSNNVYLRQIIHN
jgi:hypothetical protein